MRMLSDGERAILQQDGPDEQDEPWRVLSHRVVRRARRPHRCNGGCRAAAMIHPGEPYQRTAFLDGHEQRFVFLKICMGCNARRAGR